LWPLAIFLLPSAKALGYKAWLKVAARRAAWQRTWPREFQTFLAFFPTTSKSSTLMLRAQKGMVVQYGCGVQADSFAPIDQKERQWVRSCMSAI
jgi:hypothetical protein